MTLQLDLRESIPEYFGRDHHQSFVQPDFGAEKKRGPPWRFSAYFSVRDAEMTIKIIFKRLSQKGGRQGVPKEGQQGTHLEILLSP